ncbi:hypothetical protein HaLaN_26465 [Haematococcus lacustris]|uniref:Uncharacterized protein n=1 Tax=Haematococcus lacustris TaxID=44745 RepID=A0A6A0A688_HAELA|nr:hypothetical protein HaLaN_26465 [Haematococcus lacustris]
MSPTFQCLDYTVRIPYSACSHHTKSNILRIANKILYTTTNPMEPATEAMKRVMPIFWPRFAVPNQEATALAPMSERVKLIAAGVALSQDTRQNVTMTSAELFQFVHRSWEGTSYPTLHGKRAQWQGLQAFFATKWLAAQQKFVDLQAMYCKGIKGVPC